MKELCTKGKAKKLQLLQATSKNDVLAIVSRDLQFMTLDQLH
jgi:hypothetical protein